MTGTPRWLLLSAATVLAAVFALALIPGLVAQADPLATDAARALRAPSATAWLGTDQVGRDVFSRIVHAARPALAVGLGATLLAATLGSLLGSLLGLAPEWADRIGARLIEALMSIPEFLLALIAVALIGPGPVGVFAALTIAAVPGYARLARAATLAVRSAEHVTAARVLGFGPVRVFLGHLLPVTLRPVVALGAVGVGTVMLGAASLSFLGLGAQPPAPDWGMMLSESRSFASRAWWLVVFPGLALALVVGSVTVLGRAARERMR